jgi:hypothetical protein
MKLQMRVYTKQTSCDYSAPEYENKKAQLTSG